MGLIENLNWRYATKKFDTDKKITRADLEKIKDAVQLSASSYGFQPYKVLIIENEDLRKKLQVSSYKQGQIVDASHLLVFAANIKTDAADVDALMQLTASTRGFGVENLQGYSDYIKGAIGWMPAEMQTAWNVKQTYIALSTLLVATAELEIDSCPMEGFVAAEYDEILGLKAKGLTAALVATIGYRAADDATDAYAKVRKPKTELFEVL
jgi:nitroreductase